MLRLSNISIGIKLAAMSVLGVLLVAAMIGTQMLGNATVRGSIETAIRQANLTQNALDAKASVRGLLVAVGEIRVARSTDDLSKAMKYLRDRDASAKKYFDEAAQLSRKAETTERQLAIGHPDFPTENTVTEARHVIQRPLTDHPRAPHQVTEADSSGCAFSCGICPAHELNLCAGIRTAVSEADWIAGASPASSSTHVIPARRTICHPKEWSESIPIICQGWAASSLTLLDGRRQILSFLLPGDLVSTTCLFEPMSGRTVEAVTDVTCRKFSRSDLKAFLFQRPILLEKLAKTWVEERTQADQLALDLGRRTADERIARLILNLAGRLAKRHLVTDQTMEFPLRQRHIADATGLTPVHVSKVLGEFQRAGLIEINRRSLTIINETELRRAADWR